MAKIKSPLILTVITMAVFSASFIGYGYWLINKDNSFPKQVVVVNKGSGVSSIAATLKKQGIIKATFWFKIASKLYGAEKNIKAGEYEITSNISIKEILNTLQFGKNIQYYITFPEGLTSKEILAHLKSSKLDSNGVVGEIEEGALLPETYAYTAGENASSVLNRMKLAMEKALDEAWENRDEGLPLKNKQELLILASIVEKETSVGSERAEVAGVFINRLRKGMKLQSDPTVIYGASNYKGDITYKHLKEKHPYNTYVIKALPIGPICNPGKASLMAAAQPNMTNNLFFVADGDGGHVFAINHSQHKKNVANYLKKLRSRK